MLSLPLRHEHDLFVVPDADLLDDALGPRGMSIPDSSQNGPKKTR